MNHDDGDMDNSDPKHAWIEQILMGLMHLRDVCAGVAAAVAAELARRGVEQTSRVLVRVIRLIAQVLQRRFGRPW